MPFSVGWIVVAALWLLNAAWLAIGGFTIAGSLKAIAAFSTFGLVALACRSRFPRTSASLHALAMNLPAAQAAFIFCYLCATPAYPLVDEYLAAADHTIGFDWPWWYQLAVSSPLIFSSLRVLYSILWVLQTGLLPLLLPLFNPRRNTEFVVTITIATVITAILSMRFPAEGAMFYNQSNVSDVHEVLIDGLRDFTALRDGSLRVFDFTSVHGIIAFPSFHTASAILYAYAVRGSGRLFRVVACTNGLMLFSIPIFGGHYLVDMLAGLGVAALTIYVTRRISDTFADNPLPKTVELEQATQS